MAGKMTPVRNADYFDVLDRMKDFTGPSLSMICGCITENTGELVGSGTIMSLRGRPHLFTAQHVVLEVFQKDLSGLLKYPVGPAHSVGSGNLMVHTGPRWRLIGDVYDLALISVEPEFLERASLVPLSPDLVAPHTRDLDETDVYFVHGWPQKYSRFTTFEGRGVMARSLPYGGWLTTQTTWPDFDPSIHLATTFAMADSTDVSGTNAIVPIPQGVSGSLLWKTNRASAGKSWEPTMAKVIGLVHRFDQEAQCLIATRIEYVGGFLVHSLRQINAYARWEGRGKPIGDDWADWFPAEQEIRSLR